MMSLAPSDIHFLQGSFLLTPQDEDTLDILGARLKGLIPKVQVAEKNGSWFALNNSYLHIARDLEKNGRCAKVGVEVVPLNRVPKILQEGMVVPYGTDSSSCHESWSEEGDSTSYTSSDYTDEDDDDLSDSEYDDDDFTCSSCERSFDSLELLEQHRRNRCSITSCYSTKSSSIPHNIDEDNTDDFAFQPKQQPPEEMQRLI